MSAAGNYLVYIINIVIIFLVILFDMT